MRSPLPSFKWFSILFLVLSGYISIVSIVDAEGSTKCDPQTFSPEDCPTPSGEETNNDDDDDRGNIEEEIPSVIPFP